MKGFFLDPCKYLDQSQIETIWQIGAFDGQEIIKYASNLKWQFHLFEPNPLPFQHLHHNFKMYPNVHCYQIAVTDEYVSSVDLYVPTIFGPWWSDQVAGLTPKVAEKASLHPDKLIVPAIHRSRLQQYTKSNPTCIITDTEGEDYRFFPLIKAFLPKVYKFEWCHLGNGRLENGRTILKSHGYEKLGNDKLDEIWILNNPNVSEICK